MKDPTTISPEEDEEQMIMRRLRNSCDELRRGYRWLDYRMQRVKQKAEQSKEERETIELPEEKVSVRGEPIPFKVTKTRLSLVIMKLLPSLGLHPHGRGDPVQEGPEGGWRENGVQGNQAEQQNYAQLQTDYW